MIKPRKNIVWLASYPKSGNTWFRVFLSNLLSQKEEPANINNLLNSTIASSRNEFEEITGIDSSMLTLEEIEKLKPKVYNYISAKKIGLVYKKIHDAYTYNIKNEPIIPKDSTKIALYFIRNPLDVAVSFSYHNAVSIDKIIEIMSNQKYAFCSRTDRISNQLQQPLFTWSEHVESWTKQKHIPVHVIKYEDMNKKAFETFSLAVKQIGIQATKKEIEAAIKKSDINILKTQEEKEGFKEKPGKNDRFFRKGIVGDYKNHLTQIQIDKIIHDHSYVMKKFGYL
jgi:hypothetical protein